MFSTIAFFRKAVPEMNKAVKKSETEQLIKEKQIKFMALKKDRTKLLNCMLPGYDTRLLDTSYNELIILGNEIAELYSCPRLDAAENELEFSRKQKLAISSLAPSVSFTIEDAWYDQILPAAEALKAVKKFTPK